MAEIFREAHVRAGAWRTLESGWGYDLTCIFSHPVGARVKVRYGDGRWRGWNSQLRTLSGNPTSLTVSSGASRFRGRVQIRVREDTDLSWTNVTTSPEPPH